MCFNYSNNTTIKSYDPQVRHAFVVANYAFIRICYSCHIIPELRINVLELYSYHYYNYHVIDILDSCEQSNQFQKYNIFFGKF